MVVRQAHHERSGLGTRPRLVPAWPEFVGGGMVVRQAHHERSELGRRPRPFGLSLLAGDGGSTGSPRTVWVGPAPAPVRPQLRPCLTPVRPERVGGRWWFDRLTTNGPSCVPPHSRSASVAPLPHTPFGLSLLAGDGGSTGSPRTVWVTHAPRLVPAWPEFVGGGMVVRQAHHERSGLGTRLTPVHPELVGGRWWFDRLTTNGLG